MNNSLKGLPEGAGELPSAQAVNNPEAKVDCSQDGVPAVDVLGKTILQNQRMTDLWDVPEWIYNHADAKEELRFVSTQTKDPAKFPEKVTYLLMYPDKVSRDEIELQDDRTLECYSSPVLDVSGTNYGRI